MSPRLASGSTVVVAAAVALVAWWLNPGGGDTPTTDDPASSARSPYTTSASRSPATTAPAQPTTSAGSVPETDPRSGLPYVPIEELPPEAIETVHLIDNGGPFPYDEDGSTFGNYEGLLPDEPEGYYREYTVETPGSDDRGARRIVGGADGELYWTEDHYESFEVIWRATP